MATQESLDLVQTLYVAYYGRPADPSGQQYWAEQIDEQGVDAIINYFGTSPEFDERFGSMSHEQLVNNLYYQLFGRAAESEGLQFYVDHLDAGNLTLAEIALTIATGAQNDDVVALDNKLAVAQSFTDALDTPNELAAYQGNAAANYARQYLVNVDEDTDPAAVDVDDFIDQLVQSSAQPGDQSVFTLTELPTQTETKLSWNGIDVDVALAFLQSIGDLNLEDLGIEISGDKIINVDNIHITDNSLGGATISVTTIDGEVIMTSIDTPAALYAHIIDGLQQNVEVTRSGIVLTPTQNNGGAFENGYTTGGNDLIIAGRTELLHGAYIDGGGGYNTLRVDMKGPFAQPFQLLNIQEVQVQNLLNVYNIDWDEFGLANLPVPDIATQSSSDSILDLSRADSLQKLLITEGITDGGLTLAGINAGAVARLEGNFAENVTLHYGAGLGNSLQLELANVTMHGGALALGHNAGAVDLLSEGRLNVLEDANFGAYLRELTITGSGELVINSDLNFAFGEAHIDASANTGGLRLNIGAADGLQLNLDGVSNLLQQVSVLGSQGDDLIRIDDTDAGVLLNVDTGAGDDTLILTNVDPGRGSSIAGENLTVRIVGTTAPFETRLDLVELSGDLHFELQDSAILVVTQAQVEALGIDAFTSLHRGDGTLKVLVQEDIDLSTTDLLNLDRNLALVLELEDGVTLTATRADLDRVGGIEIDARADDNGSTVVVTDLPADSQTDLGTYFSAVTPVENLVISIDGLVADDDFEITNSGGPSTPDATLSVAGVNDLSEGLISGIEAVEYAADGAELTLTEWQVRDTGVGIGEGNFSLGDGVTDATLHVSEVDGSLIDLAEIADAGINIGTLVIEDTGGVVTLHADTTLGGADEIIVPEGTTLNLSAAQFLQLDGGVISGEGTVNITGLTQADIDAGLDLSTITALNGTISLTDNDVTLDPATDLGDFAVVLDGENNDPNNPMEGQTIRFATAEQASREINTTGTDPGETNVVWLEDGDFAGQVVDTSGYSGAIGRLWISEGLVNSTAGNNVEALYTQLSGNIIVRIYTDDLLAVSNPVHRVVEVEAFAAIDGLTFLDADADAPFQHVESLTITLGGASNIGDLMIDNIVAPDVVNDTPFNTLTINSWLADSDDHYLLPEDFDPDFHALPIDIADPQAQWNVIGDISSGADREELANVVLNTSGGPNGETGVALDIQTITFSETEATTALFDVNGDNDVTVKSLDTSDADITGLTVDTTGMTGAGSLTVTGGSPAAAVSNTETLTINAGGDVALGTATDDADNPYAGVAGPDLSTLTVTGAGAVDLGVIALIDSEDFTLTGNGATTAVLGEANVDGALVAPELSATGTWTISETNLTITEDVVFNAGGELTLDDVDLTVEGAVDLSELALVTVNGTEVTVSEGATLTLTAEQADGLTVTGAGDVVITELEAAPGADLSNIMTGSEDTGTVTAQLDSTDDVELTGDLGVAHITISGEGEVSVSGNINEASFTVGSDATLALTANQADGRLADGAGTVNVGDLGVGPADIDLSGLTAATVNAAVDSDFVAGDESDFGTAVVTVAAGVGLAANAEVVDGQTINGVGGVIVISDAIGSDFSNFGVENIAFAPDIEVDGVTFPTLYGDPTLEGTPDEEPVQRVILTAEQASGETITGADGGNEGRVTVEELGVDEVDLSGIDAGEMSANVPAVPADPTLDENTDLGGFAVVVAIGATLTLSGEQADGREITGDGSVVLTDVESGQDFSNVNLTAPGTLTILAAAGVTELELTAAQLDGLDVTVDGGPDLTKVTVTEFEAAPGADLSEVKVVAPSVTNFEVQLDSSGDVEIGADANMAASFVVISGNGEVTVADGASLFGVDGIVVNAGARLVADQSLSDADSVINLGIVSGLGTLQLVGIDGETITLVDSSNTTDDIYDGSRFTELTFEAGDTGVTVENFEAGTFTYDSNDLLNGAHRLDFTELFDAASLSFEDVSALLDGSDDNSGLADILSFSVAAVGDFTAEIVAAAFQQDGAFENNTAVVNFGVGAEKLFLVSNNTDTAAFYWEDGIGGAADGVVDAGELAAMATLKGIDLAGLADLENANFVLA